LKPQRLYLDNAATSFPKPSTVMEAMTRYATELGASPGRGAYAEAREAGELMQQCRQRINTLIHGEDENHVIFTLNTSDALNLAIRGIVMARQDKPDKPHVITSDLDHNSVLRPYNALEAAGLCTQSRIRCDPQTGLIDPDAIKQTITKQTCLVAVVHGSNVSGTMQPIAEIGAVCREMAVPLAVDAAQTCGHSPIDVQRDCIDLLAAPGHKGLLGPLGTGFLYIRPGVENIMTTVREGGTGSRSELDTQPDFMPDRFETGSHNAIGIIGLSEGVAWLLDETVEKLWQHEQDLCKTMIDGLSDIPGLTYLGPQGIKHRCGVFSVRSENFNDPNTLAETLETEFGILTRAGIHCAPHAHETFDTHRLGGTTRLSFGPFVSKQDVKYACDALSQVCDQATIKA